MARQPSLQGSLPHSDFQRTVPDIVDAYQKRYQQRHWTNQPTIRTKTELPIQCSGSRTSRQLKDETHMSHEPNDKRPSSKPTPNEKLSDAPLFQARDLPPIKSNEPPEAVNYESQKPQSVHRASMRPTPPPSSTPPEQRISRSIGVENLLNPAAGGSSNAESQPRDGERTDSSQAVPMAATSRPATPSFSSTTVRKSSGGDITLPSITPPLMNAYPQPIPRAMTPRSPTNFAPGVMTTGLPTATIDARQSPFVGPPHQVSTTTGPGPSFPADMVGTASNVLSTAYTTSAPSIRSSPRSCQGSQSGQSASVYPRMQTLLDPPTNTIPAQFSASSSSSPSIHHRTPPPANVGQATPIGKPQSFFSAPLTSMGPASAVPQLVLDKKTPLAAGPTGQNQYQMMTLDTESGPIQVPVDVQAASKVADEKRRRNATASHRFRQRRKEKEQETSNNIAKLEAQVRDLNEEKDFYQRERDFLQDFILRNRMPVPPRPTSPRRLRHASLGGPTMMQYQDSEGASREEGRNTRRRTSAYVPPQGPPPSTVEPPPPMHSFERPSAVPPEHLQGLHQGVRQPFFNTNANPFDPSAPR